MSYLDKLFNTSFFQNKFVLYGSLFLVLLSILRHLANGNVNAVVLMALIGLVMSYFSKNMIIVLLTAFATVFVLETVGSQGVMEGMETKKKKDNTDEEEDTAENADDDKDKDNAKGGNKETEKDKKKNDKNANKSEEKNTDKKKEENQNSLSSQNDPTKKKKQGMTSLSPASYDGKEHDGEGAHDMKESNRIDYASTLEQAYDNIENIIGEEGVRGLTDQTKSLMHQQKDLMDNMKEMGPLLKSAEGFMEQLTGTGGISGITSMLKGIATPGGKK